MRLRLGWIIAALIVVILLIAFLSTVSVKLDLPPKGAPAVGSAQMPWTPGLIVWVVAWVAAAAIGFGTVCVFAVRLVRRLFGHRPLP
jgi:hypothetical protein